MELQPVYGIVVESLTIAELITHKRRAVSSLVRWRKIYNTPKEERFGNMSDAELQTFIQMDKNLIAILEFATRYTEEEPELRQNLQVWV
jgi:hypothetical protein